MNRFQHILAVGLLGSLVLLWGGTAAAASAYPSPTSAFFVNDFADVVTAKDEQIMCAAGQALDRQTTAQVVLCTVETLDGKALETYSLELGREWGIGSKEKNNGVLILFAEQERKLRVEVGYGLEGDLPDGKTGRLMDVYAMDLLREDRFSEGLTALYQALVNEVYLAYGDEVSDYTPIDEVSDEPSAWAKLIAGLVILALIFLFRGRGGFFPLMFFGGGGSGGGHSSGGFGGGGFGGFSGGGGSFGGGGASRGF